MDLYGAMALDEDWVIINQMIKYYKFGFGRATDYLNLDIRNNLISRERAIKIVENKMVFVLKNISIHFATI